MDVVDISKTNGSINFKFGVYIQYTILYITN